MKDSCQSCLSTPSPTKMTCIRTTTRQTKVIYVTITYDSGKSYVTTTTTNLWQQTNCISFMSEYTWSQNHLRTDKIQDVP